MARVKRGVTSHAKHKKVLKAAKGYYGRRKNTIRIAKQAVEKANQYAFRDRKRSAVRQEILDDVVAVGLEQHAGAAVLGNLLVGPLDHAVTLAGEGRFHLAAGGNLEALFSARLRLQLGHFALL